MSYFVWETLLDDRPRGDCARMHVGVDLGFGESVTFMNAVPAPDTGNISDEIRDFVNRELARKRDATAAAMATRAMADEDRAAAEALSEECGQSAVKAHLAEAIAEATKAQVREHYRARAVYDHVAAVDPRIWR